MRTTPRHHLLSLALLLTLARPARADDIARAREIFAEGVRLYQAGDWEGARRRFHDADAEHHAPAIVYNLALAEERLGHLQAAVDRYEGYLGEAGDKGDFSTAAAAAIARIRSRSTRLRLDTRPPGGKLFVDGTPLDEVAPTSLLVSAGHHIVVAQGDGWRDEQSIDTRGEGDVLAVSLRAPDPPARDVPPIIPDDRELPRARARPVERSAPVDAPKPAPQGLTWGLGFGVVPIVLFGATASTSLRQDSAFQVFAGPALEIGWALAPRLAVLARGLVAIGQEGKPSYAFMGGPGITYRATSWLRTGASFIGGQVETLSHAVTYTTDLVFGTMLEANVVMLSTRSGEWLVGVQPTALFANVKEDNFPLILPLTFGYRAD